MPQKIQLEQLTLCAGRPLVTELSLTLRRGQVLALLGSSGCGKSLTCAAALGVLPPGVRQTAGRLLLDGIPVHGEQLRAVPSPRLCRIRAAPLIRCIRWQLTREKPAAPPASLRMMRRLLPP